MEGVGRVSEAGAGEVGVCEATAAMVTAAGATRLLYRHQKSMH